MRKKFVIIGLTGAIGSGCKKLSEFISEGISKSKSQIRADLEKTNLSIRKHFEYIKEEINIFNEQKDNGISSLNTETSLKDYYSAKPKSEIAREIEKKLKAANKNLRELLIRRKVLQYSINLDKNFFKISMSNLLVKLMLENCDVNDPSSNKNKIFENYFSKPDTPLCIKNILKEHYDEIIKSINKFNIAPQDGRWDKNDYNDFDNMILELGHIKNEIFQSCDKCREFFQNAGDNARATGNPFDSSPASDYTHISILAQEANKIIKYMRNREQDSTNFFIINSFRNPAEVQFFRKRYGSFYLASLYASKETRKINNPTLNDQCDARDAGNDKDPKELNKQDVPRCTLLSDYAITTDFFNNNAASEEHYKFEAIRFLTLIDFPGLVPPRNDEEVMNLAYSLSLRSTCLSRQVGAVITNPEGFIIAAGWNSVGSGQLGCSQLCIDDYTRYANDSGGLLFNWKESIDNFEKENLLSKKGTDCFCFKDLQSKIYLNNKIDTAAQKITKTENDPKVNENMKNICSLKDRVSVKRLEYARALHAEENAILQAARFGGTGIAGGTIYTTTYPCELCSKKIYQAQLSRIVYTEPYPDSLSEKLFLKDGIRQISIEQFEGVKSPSFFRLFKPAFDLKEYQTIDGHGADEDL